MNIYLVRHTTPDIELIYCYGQSDVNVKDTFDDELSRIQSILSDLGVAQIFSSPLSRCKKLATALNRGTVHFDDRLKELNFGDWEMQPWKEIDKKSLDHWVEDFVCRSAPGGESYQQMCDRASNFIREIVEKDFDDVVIVSHGGTIRSILTTVLEMPLKNLFKININFAGVSMLYTDKGRLKVGYINR